MLLRNRQDDPDEPRDARLFLSPFGVSWTHLSFFFFFFFFLSFISCLRDPSRKRAEKAKVIDLWESGSHPTALKGQLDCFRDKMLS